MPTNARVAPHTWQLPFGVRCLLRRPVVQICFGSMVVSVKRRVLWTVINVLGFLVAVVIFYLGLGVGLAFNPLLGALLWILALALMP